MIPNTYNPLGVNRMSNDLFVGAICAGLNTEAPTGWLLLNGQAVSRIKYSKLFSLLGTKYGNGDGSTTFNLPDLTLRFLQMDNSNLGNYIEAGLPNIGGKFRIEAQLSDATGAFYGDGQVNWSGNRTSVGLGICHFDASRVNTIYGNSNTVQPSTFTVNYFIKY